MNKERRSHIRKLQNRAVLSLLATIFTILSVGFGILCLFVSPIAAILFFAVAVMSMICLLSVDRIAKKEIKEGVYKPVLLDAGRNFSFEELAGIFETMTDKENQLSTSEDVRFFRLVTRCKYRMILYRTANFDKKEFDAAKDRINKKANKELDISPWVKRNDARKMMRLNVIYTHTVNDALYQFLSQNANHNLTRVEGILNIAVVGHQMMIPPLYGKCDLLEISRYKAIMKFINQVILNK